MVCSDPSKLGLRSATKRGKERCKGVVALLRDGSGYRNGNYVHKNDHRRKGSVTGSWISFQPAIVARLRRSFVTTLPRAQECSDVTTFRYLYSLVSVPRTRRSVSLSLAGQVPRTQCRRPAASREAHPVQIARLDTSHPPHTPAFNSRATSSHCTRPHN